MDNLDTSEKDLRECFRFMGLANKYAGGYRVTIKALDLLLKNWPKEKMVEILDVGCGNGNTAGAISKWSKTRGYNIHYMGIDNNKKILRLAEDKTIENNARYVNMDLFNPNIPPADFIISSLLFHHLDDIKIPEAIEHLFAKSRHALIINDLRRSRLAFIICFILTRFIWNKASRNDALLSIRKGFLLEEIQLFLDKLNIKGILKKRLGFKFLLIIRK